MRRLLAALALSAACVVASAAPAVAQEPRILTAAQLIDERERSDGRTVRVQGEAIGDILSGGDGHVWVNVLSDGVAVGLWMPREQAEVVETLGDYDNIGTELEALGVFNAACDQHHGDADVHVRELRAVHEGRPREHSLQLWKLALAGVFSAAGIAIAFWYRAERRRIS